MLKKIAFVAALGCVIAAFAPTADARVFVGVNIGIPLGYPAPYYYGPAYYAPAPVVYTAAPVVVAPPAPQVFYFCQSTQSYYPTVPTCSQPWTRVLPNGTVLADH